MSETCQYTYTVLISGTIPKNINSGPLELGITISSFEKDQVTGDLILIFQASCEQFKELKKKFANKRGRTGTKVEILKKVLIPPVNYYQSQKIYFNIDGSDKPLWKNRSRFLYPLSTSVVKGGNLKKGQKLFSYTGYTDQSRPVLVIFLDGKSRFNRGDYI